MSWKKIKSVSVEEALEIARGIEEEFYRSLALREIASELARFSLMDRVLEKVEKEINSAESEIAEIKSLGVKVSEAGEFLQ